ncbi:integral membrane protein [Viridothelium virens]|uniref:Integral membrane protein n=1 Tax=Viridothelium virens TaxID=1048519 RepID=A0A6A6HG82_VIRVR|nr:integral membrane protein [Viridothelium virens]
MLRSNTFNPDRQPLRHNTTFTLYQDHTRGPVPFLNPTRARYEQYYNAAEKTKPALTYQWTSRDNRKGRHRLIVPSASDSKATESIPGIDAPKPSNSLQSVSHGLWLMCTYYPVWDISFDVAYIFTWGSIVWVINAFFSFLPLAQPSTEFPGEIQIGGGITAFIGATIFEIGSVLLLIEAVNAGREGCFGWAVENACKSTTLSIRPDKSRCIHHHPNKRNLVGSTDTTLTSSTSRNWTWFPTLSDLRTHYLHELGFLASLVQFFAATIFWIAGFTALPHINSALSPGALDGIYWTPQVLGGVGFIVSGFLFMLETQPNWYTPALGTLGWHIGLWNLIGGVGFTLCPAFGYCTKSWCVYQASLSTFWGSWAFLVGSAVQWYESLQKYPVEVEKGGKKVVDS